MGIATTPEPVKYFCGIITASATLAARVEKLLVEEMGAVDFRSEPIPFDFTGYYTKEMGKNLLRSWISFARLGDPGELSGVKALTNLIERETARDGGGRQINLDPGYLALSKLVLASTKDFSHRIYLSDGIYAETTLLYKKDAFEALPWTYPDYMSETAQKYFGEVREAYHEQLKALPSLE